MFDNVGRKIKALTKIVAYGGIALSIILGILICSLGEDLILIGIIIMIAGSFLSWLSALRSYAFGQLVDNTDRLVTFAQREDKRASLIQDRNSRVNTTATQATMASQAQQTASNAHNPAFIYCTKCGTKQRANRTVCMACGVTFLKNN